MFSQPPAPAPPAPSRWSRLAGVLKPSHAHSALTATLFLMATTFLSRIIGLVRVKYIAWQFGAGPQTDAYQAAFRLPDLMNYFLVGGAASITFVTLLNRYRESGLEKEGERLLSIVLSFVGVVLVVATLGCMFVAAPYIRYTNPGFAPWQIELSARMTRILLPGQIFFFLGTVLGATLIARRQFLIQGITPLIYNLAIIAGGVIFSHRLGISSLAVGALSGAFLGPFVLNVYGSHRLGFRFRWGIDFAHPGLRDWIKMTLPLMAGFTLPFLDDYIVGYFASHGAGEITRLTNAKQLFSAPMAVLAQAAGAASLPFFARLWAQNKRFDFASTVADSVSRVAALALLAASAMIALGKPLVEIIFLGGRFTDQDVAATAGYFALYSLSLFLWSAQAIYARAFYAAGITWLPMLAGSMVTLAALPFYFFGYRWGGAAGLALASGAGIFLQVLILALLLHAKRMVSLASLDYAELSRCLLASVASGVILWLVLRGALDLLHLAWTPATHFQLRCVDLAQLALGGALWAILVAVVLALSGSALPRAMLKKLGWR